MASSTQQPQQQGPTAVKTKHRQRRMGPAPFASFEDLSDDLESPEEKDKPISRPLPGIREDVRMAADGTLVSPCSAASGSMAGVGGLQTPSTPRIDISRASSSSHQDSNNSSPERELFAAIGDGGSGAKLGLGFKEEGAADLRSSTEELDFHEEHGTVTEREEKRRRERRLAKQQAAQQQQQGSVFKYELEAQSEKERKDSACSDIALLSISGRTSRLSSIGSAASGGSGASNVSHISHISGMSHLSVVSGRSGASSGRSPSPHKMLLETSFCGSKPIVPASVDDEPAANKHETERLEKSILSRQLEPTVAIVEARKEEAKVEIKRKVKEESKVVGSDTLKDVVKEKKDEKSRITEDLKTEIKDKEDKLYSKSITDAPAAPQIIDHTRTEFRNEWQLRDRDEWSGPPVRPAIKTKEPPQPVIQREMVQKPVTLNLSESTKSVKPLAFPQVIQRETTQKVTESISSTITAAPKPLSETPSASPKLSRHAMLKKSEDGGSRTPSPSSTSRKSSFTNLFKRNEVPAGTVLSPESPTVAQSGKRKTTGFTSILKEASEGFRERSRSRSKSRERVSSSMTITSTETKVDAKGKKDTKNKSVFSSLFKKKDRKKGSKGSSESDVISPVDLSSPEQKLSIIEPIGNVEFTFNTETSQQQSSENVVKQARSEVKEERTSTENASIELHEPLPSESIMLPGLPQTYHDTSAIEERDKNESVVLSLVETKDAEASLAEEITTAAALLKEAVTPEPAAESEIERTSSKEKVLDEATASEEADHHSSESERDSEVEYLRNKAAAALKKQLEEEEEEDHERKGLVLQDSFEDELPYVPTTLPQERSVAVPIKPIKQRIAEQVKTCPIERPRSTTPINPSLLEEYVQCSATHTDEVSAVSGTSARDQAVEKMRICLPREDSITGKAKSPRRVTGAKSWFEFAEQGLHSPREYRKPSLTQPSENNIMSPSPPPPPLPPRAQPTPPPQTPPPKPSGWINFEEIPEKRKPPKRIQTIPSRGTLDLPDTSKLAVTVENVVYSYVNPEECKCECHEAAGRQTQKVEAKPQCSHSATAVNNDTKDTTTTTTTTTSRLDVDVAADRHSYMSDSSYEYPSPYSMGDEADTLKPMKPFGMDLDVSSNRSSIISQDEPHSPDIGSPNVLRYLLQKKLHIGRYKYEVQFLRTWGEPIT